MQDNARVHTAAVTREFLREHHINTIDWPAYSPDLNPIEHLWWHLKKRMYKLYPQYDNYSEAEEEWNGFLCGLERLLACHTWEAYQAPHHEHAAAHSCLQSSARVANKVLMAYATFILKIIELHCVG